MPLYTHAPKFAAAAAAILWSAAAHAASDPTGIWFDHNKRGAVEIKECADGKGLCGQVVYVVDPANAKNCGMQILGEVTGDGGGWIYSPERKRRYDVALKRLSDDKLRVVGNAGSKFFSRTYTWHRAPDDILKCSETTAAAPAKPAEPAAQPTTAEAPATTETKPAETTAAAPAQSDAKPATETAKPADTAAAQSDAKPAAETTKTAQAPEKTEAAKESESEDSGAKAKTCKFRIPFIGKTINVPCDD
jgi:uncharacterized protein (DUF2147 family)